MLESYLGISGLLLFIIIIIIIHLALFSLLCAPKKMNLIPFARMVVLMACLVAGQEEGEGVGVGSYKIEGKVTPPDVKPANWLTVTTVTLDGGKRRAFLKEDNSFVFQGVSSGTFLVEVENPDYMYEQVQTFST